MAAVAMKRRRPVPHPPRALQSVSLPDVLQQAPARLQSLTPEALGALSCCSTQLRTFIHSTATTIFIGTPSTPDDCSNHASPAECTSLSQVFATYWERLSLVVLQLGRLPEHMQQLSTGQLQVAAALTLVGREDTAFHGMISRLWERAFILVQPAATEHRNECLSQLTYLGTAFRHLQLPQYATLQRLQLSHSNLEASSFAQLTLPEWPNLTYLDLNSNRLTADALSILAKGRWPQLYWLDVSNCELDADAVAQLVLGHWPELEVLYVSANRFSAKAVSLLATASWPKISELRIRNMKLSISAMNALHTVLGTWVHLHHIDLRWSGITVLGVRELCFYSLSHINSLDFIGNNLTASAVAALVYARLPKLRSLKLSENILGLPSAKHLWNSNWPELRCLELSDNLFDNESLEWLAQAEWPELLWLSLDTNTFDIVGICFLAKAHWLNIETLVLDSSLLNPDIWAVLNLDPTYVFQADDDEHEVHYVPRLLLDNDRFEYLHDVHFCQRRTCRVEGGQKQPHPYNPFECE